MQTATTPGTGQGLNGRFRFKDNAGNCAVISCESTSGTRVHTNDANCGAHLLPGTAKVWRVIANPYQFLIFTSCAAASREFACGGVPYLPSNSQGAIWEAIWLQASSAADGNTGVWNSLRSQLYSGPGNYQARLSQCARLSDLHDRTAVCRDTTWMLLWRYRASSRTLTSRGPFRSR
jgi:hypothetical protein